MPLDDDVRSAAACGDPHGFYARLRAHDPVHWSARSRAWLVSSHAEVLDAFKDERLSSDRLSPLEAREQAAGRRGLDDTFDLLRAWMVFRDEPDHSRLRGPVGRVFTPRRVEALTPRITALVEGHLDALARLGRFDLMREFAFPLPAIVIAELLGVAAEDRERFKSWSRQLAGLVFGAIEKGGRDLAASRATSEFRRYFGALIEERRRRPGDDLVSALVAASETGDALSPEQVVGACTMLLFGGHETTTTLIVNGAATLLEHPGELERLRAQPELAGPAVEELLRFAGPATAMVRHVRVTHRRGGHPLEPGQRLYLGIAGANRDPDVFEEPDRLDLGRDPNPHLSFGHGPHFCLGAALARAEARIALGALVARFPRLRLAAGPPAWGGTVIGRGLAELPVAVD